MKTYSQKGFTLIELLVVIAIIGILSSVVIVSLSAARAKAGDAAIRTNMATVRIQSEFYYDSHSNSYGSAGTSTISLGGVCGSDSGLFTDTTIKNALSNAVSQSGDISKAYCGALNTISNTWAVSIPLKTDPNTSWCIGNVGKATAIPTPADQTAFKGC